MTPVLSERNIVLVNSLRNAALKSSSDFNAVKFFADLSYAKECLVRFERSEVPELAALAVRAKESLFRVAPHPAVLPVAPLGVAPLPAALPANEPAAMAVGERFTATKELMNGLVVDAVGLRSFFFVLKLERCASTEDLKDLLPAFHKLLAKGMGGYAADMVMAQVRRTL